MVATDTFDPARVRELPQALGRWELGVRPAPKEMRRIDQGKVVVVLDTTSGMARASNVVPKASADAMLGVLIDAMTRSASGQASCRPRQLAVETRALEHDLGPLLEPCGIRVVVVPMLPLVDDFMQGLAEHMRGRPPRSPIGALVMEKPLAEAAARIAALEPWRYIPGELPLLIEDETSGRPPRVLVVMGEARKMEGIAAYDDEGQLRKAIDSELPFGSWCLLFHRAFEVPRRIRDEFIQLGLPVAHGLYPHFALLARAGVPAVIERKEDAKRILADLEALERYVSDCSQALADAKEPRREGLELSNGQRINVTPKRDLAPDDLFPPESEPGSADGDGPGDDSFWGEDAIADAPKGALGSPTNGAVAHREPNGELGAELRAVLATSGSVPDRSMQDDPWPVPEAVPASGRPSCRGEEDEPEADRHAAAAGLPFGLGDLTYRVTLCTMPTPLLRGARGARVALWQTEQRRGVVPERMPAIIVKMSKREAETAARELHRIDRAVFRRLAVLGENHELLVVSHGDGDERVLASWPVHATERPPSAWSDETGDEEGALLLFVSGGAGRALRALAPGAIVAGQHVAIVRDPPRDRLECSESARPAPAEGHPDRPPQPPQ